MTQPKAPKSERLLPRIPKCKVCRLEHFSKEASHGRTRALRYCATRQCEAALEKISQVTSLKSLSLCGDDHREVALGLRKEFRLFTKEIVSDKQFLLKQATELLAQKEFELQAALKNPLARGRADLARLHLFHAKMLVAQRRRRLRETASKLR